MAGTVCSWLYMARTKYSALFSSCQSSKINDEPMGGCSITPSFTSRPLSWFESGLGVVNEGRGRERDAILQEWQQGVVVSRVQHESIGQLACCYLRHVSHHLVEESSDRQPNELLGAKLPSCFLARVILPPPRRMPVNPMAWGAQQRDNNNSYIDTRNQLGSEADRQHHVASSQAIDRVLHARPRRYVAQWHAKDLCELLLHLLAGLLQLLRAGRRLDDSLEVMQSGDARRSCQLMRWRMQGYECQETVRLCALSYRAHELRPYMFSLLRSLL